MSDEVRSSSRSTPPEPEASPSDPVAGPTALDLEIPTPDLDTDDDAPDSSGPVATEPPFEVAQPRSERPPPSPSQRAAQLRAEIPALTPAVPTLPAPAPVLNVPPPAFPPPAPVPDLEAAEAVLPEASAVLPPRPAPPPAPAPEPTWHVSNGVTEPAPPPRMQSEPVPLVVRTGSGPPRPSQRPGLVEPKRIIEVLGSNVPVLDTALEEEGIEDLDESEAHEVSETPVPDSAAPDTDLELPVVVDDDFTAAPPDVAEPVPSPSAGTRGVASEMVPMSVPADPLDPLDEPELPTGPRAKAPPNKRRRPPPPSSRHHDKPKPLHEAGPRKWWEEMFSEEFLRAIPILSPRQLEREVDFVDEALSVERGGRILDLACGAGQHAVELAARGYDVVGFDLSQSQLDWASGLAQERGQRLQFTYGDMRELAYSEAFDAIYSWNTSFGFFEEEKNVDVAQRIFRALRPGGRFLLDVINRDFVVAQQPGQTWFEGDGCVCIDDVHIDFITSRMKVKRTMMLTNGKNRECTYSVRIYGLHELGKILHDVGFKVLNVSGGPEMPGVFFGSTSPRIIILAVKP